MTLGGQVARMKSDTTSRVSLLPSLGVQLIVGSRDEQRVDAISTRFAFGTSLTGLTWGAYAELPEASFGDTDVGFGVSGQYGSVFNTVTPYVQFGRRMAVPSEAWLVSQGVTLVNTEDVPGWTPILSTTFGWSMDRVVTSSMLFLTLLTGNRSYEYRCSACFSETTVSRTFILVGVSRGVRLGTPAFRPDVP